jgi:integrase
LPSTPASGRLCARRGSTARHVTGRIENHIAGTKLGGRRIAAVRPSEVQAWATERSKHLSPTNLRNLVSMVRSIFRDAVLDRLGAENPAARVTLPSFEKPLVVPLTVEQIEALEDAIDDRCRAMVIVQAGAGLRIGELLALRVEDVNFLRKTIRPELHQF